MTARPTFERFRSASIAMGGTMLAEASTGERRFIRFRAAWPLRAARRVQQFLDRVAWLLAIAKWAILWPVERFRQ